LHDVHGARPLRPRQRPIRRRLADCVVPAMREVDPRESRDSRDDHVDLARGIAIGIIVGIVMWGLAALIVWVMWRS
jgi:hypothetical protein